MACRTLSETSARSMSLFTSGWLSERRPIQSRADEFFIPFFIRSTQRGSVIVNDGDAMAVELEIALGSCGTRFEVVCSPEDGHLEFRTSDDGKVLDMYHTFVGIPMRGQGVASKLCVAAFEHCRRENLKVRPSCSYISGRFLLKHTEYSDLVLA